MDLSRDANRLLSNGLTIQQVDTQLSRRRRRSYPKACYPCRRRKVRCDKQEPCANCVRYSHPELCSYANVERRAQNDPMRSTTNESAHKRPANERLAALTDLERRMQKVAEEIVRRLSSATSGVSNVSISQSSNAANNPDNTTTLISTFENKRMETGIHIGAESLASALMDIVTSPDALDNLNELRINDDDDPDLSSHEIMKLLCMMDTGSTHPFANLWRPGATVQEICLALPNDETFEQ